MSSDIVGKKKSTTAFKAVLADKSTISLRKFVFGSRRVSKREITKYLAMPLEKHESGTTFDHHISCRGCRRLIKTRGNIKGWLGHKAICKESQ